MVNTQEHIWNRNFIFITIGNGLLFVNFHMLVPTIAMYAASIGSSGSEIGIIAGIFALSAIVVRLFTDALVGKLGKKRCLFLGLLTSLIATAGYGLFPTFGGASGGAYPSWIRVRSINDVCGGSGCGSHTAGASR